MTLSILTIPTDERETGFTKGLWDGKKFIVKGTEEECEAAKDSLEREEQRLLNSTWKEQVYADRYNLLISSGLCPDFARKTCDIMFRRFATS
jgi:hypothetical protein